MRRRCCRRRELSPGGATVALLFVLSYVFQLGAVAFLVVAGLLVVLRWRLASRKIDDAVVEEGIWSHAHHYRRDRRGNLRRTS